MAATEWVLGVTSAGRNIQTRALPNSLLFAFVAFLIGILNAGLLLGWHQIDPANLSWFKGDAAVYQAGWEFLRQQGWTFPPTWLAHLDYPFGISGAYLDVIPITAVPLHLFASLLPPDFQYLGAYVAICLILQAHFGMKLLSCFTADRLFVVVGSLFFLNAPILLIRICHGHFSLCSQWLIISGLYYYFRPVERRDLVRYLSPFAVLAAVAGGITPYLAMMVLLIGLAALLRTTLEISVSPAASNDFFCPKWSALRRLLATSHTLWVIILVASMVGSFVIFGFVTFGASPTLEDKGYGLFSMNLLSPVSSSGQSLFFNPFHVFVNQEYEGYNYLGIGVVLLGLLCLVRRPTLMTKLWSPSLRPLVVASALLTLLALSIRVTVGQTVLFVVPVPPAFLHMLTIFRASGRFFWVVYYLLVLGAVIGAASTLHTRWSRRAVLTAALVLQVLDTLPIRAAVAGGANTAVGNPLVAPDWAAVTDANKHLVILPARQCGPELTPGGDAAWPWFARLAARKGMTLNSVYAARISAASEALNCVVLPQEVAAGSIKRDTAYVLNDRLARLAAVHARTLHCQRVDGFNLCTVNPSRVRLP